MKNITKIVITGGPCAGKSTAMSWINDAFSSLGYTVLFVAETATELISGGVAPWTCRTNADYQCYQMMLQSKKEEIFERAADGMQAEDILIVCDRGALDNKAYISEEEFASCLRRIGTNEVELRDGYDAVFHLMTAAKGTDAYTLSNNSARKETPEQAIALDDRVISAWTGHPHFRVIDNSTDFEGKMRRLIAEIASFLGEPEPYEIERKFLIEYPDIKWLESDPNCKRIEIVQTYLKSDEGAERRVRQRGIGGHYTYTLTEKRKVTDVKRVEIERRLSKDEYLAYLMEVDVTRHPIRKTRFCLTYQNSYFEIDVYPFWNDKAICEIELSSEDEQITFPEKIKVIKEVTDDPSYRNSSLARM